MKNNNAKHGTREQWLEAAVVKLEPLFSKGGYKLPRVRVSCGWPSSRGLSNKKTTLGECWSGKAAEDKLAQVFITPRIGKPLDVLPVLAHEVVHAVVGTEAKHGKVFRACAVSIGLTGKMTQTVAGEELQKFCGGIVKQLGEYPHSILKPGNRPTKKQTTRMVKCECEACGYAVRTSRKWLDKLGAPLCPCNEEAMKFKVPEELEGEDE